MNPEPSTVIYKTSVDREKIARWVWFKGRIYAFSEFWERVARVCEV